MSDTIDYLNQRVKALEALVATAPSSSICLLSKPAERANTILQWVIILIIFMPISIGFFIFGKYAATNEYAHLPETSDELND